MGFILIFSCEIGLGAAVDVADPTSGISYPPKNAVVRDTFIAAGDCNDDMKVTSVKVSLIQPETNKTYGPYEAEVNEDGSGWKVSLNKNDPEKVTNAFDSYKQWEFPDGNYIISAVAYDSEGKSSPAATSPISIDNTPPVLIVSKPLAIGSEPATIYGSTLKLSGDIAEDHETSKLVVYYKQYDASTGAVIEGGNSGTIEITDSAELNAMSSSNPLIIAQFDKSGNPNEQHEKYVSLYGSTADDVDRYFYSGFMLEDSARVYQAPGDTGAGDGNQTVQYYLLGDEFQNNLAVNYSLTAQRLMNVLKGNRDDYTDSQIGSISSSLLTPGNYASSTWVSNNEASKFSLNPHNNPTWSLGNYGVSAGSTQFEPYTAGSSLVLTLNAGRDASYPDPRTVRVDLYDLGENDSSLVGKNPVCLIGPGGIFAESWDESADDSTKSYTFVLDTESFNGIEKNHLYQMVVNGTDRNKTDLEPEGQKRFIFRLSTSNNIPKVTITGPAEDITFKGDDVNANGVIIRGYVNTDGVPLKPSDELNVSRLDISDVNNSVPVTLSIANFNTTILSLAEDNEVPHKYNFELKLAKNGTNFVESTPSKYLYIATVQAKDKTGLAGEKKNKFYVDNKAPDLTINEPTPTVSETEGAATNTYVNGKITISGNASDSGVAGSGLKSLRYVIRNNLNDTVPVKSGNIPLSESWSFDVETKDLTSSEASYYVIVEAEDTVGNKNVDLDSSTPIVHTDINPNPAVKQITVKQSTDTPKLNLTNANPSVNSEAGLTQTTNMFGTTSNNKLYGSITDDDGLASVTASWQKIGSSESGTLAAASALVAGSKSYNFEYTLPSVEGKYNITINAVDNKHETNADTLNKSFVITVDNGAPTFSAVTPQTTSSSYFMGSKTGATKTLTVSGTVSDGNGLAETGGFSGKHYKKNSEGGWDEDTSATKPVSAFAASPATAPATSGSFTDNITLASVDGVYKVEYKAKDVYNQESTYALEYAVDVTNPEIDHATVGESTVNGDGWITENNVNIAAFVKDTGSGIGSVSYSLAENPGENDWTDMTHSVSEDTTTFQKWIGSVQFIDGAEKVLNLRVKDSVGNEVTQNINVKVDRTKPVLDVKWYQLSDGTAAGTSSFFTPSGTAYVNSTNNKDLVIYANYTDISDASGTDNSGVTVPTFKIGTTDITPTITYYKEAFTDDTASAATVMSASNEIAITAPNAKQQIKSFKAVISHEVFATDDVIVSGHDEAENTIENDNRAILSLTNDTTVPTISVPTISNSYKASNGTYFVRRTDDNGNNIKFTISGTSTDNCSVDKTVLSIVGQGTNSYSAELTSTAWEFTNIDFTGWTKNATPGQADATINITAYDKAGNTNSITPISIIFDEDKPAMLTGGTDGSDPDDISNPYISDYTLRGKPAYKYGGISIGSGNYGDTSYGRESSIRVGVTYIGEINGSGVSKIEYKMLASDVVPDTLQNIATGNLTDTSLLPSTWTKTGEFAVTPSTYNHKVYNSVTGRYEDSGDPINCYKGTATISGFKDTTGGKPNLLFVRATDNCGNKSDWFALIIQMDNENPEITSDSSNPISLLTNGKSTLPTLKGAVNEGASSSGLKAIRVYVDGNLAIDGNFTKTPAAGLTVHPKNSAGTELSDWTTNSRVYNQAVDVEFTNDYGTLKYIGYKDDSKAEKCSLKDAASYAEWSLTLTPQNGTWFNGIKDKSSPQISLEVEDWADDSTGSGNKSYVMISTFDIDIKDPSVTLSNPAAASLNGSHEIKGSVTENHTVKSVGIYTYFQRSETDSLPANLTDWQRYKTLTTESSPETPDSKTEYGKNLQELYSFALTGEQKLNFNSLLTKLNETDEDITSGIVHVLAFVEDKAGNTNVPETSVTADQESATGSYKKAYKTYTVDRDSDRPLVTVTHATLTTNSLLLDTRNLNVSISDDDGVEKAQYRITKHGETPEETGVKGWKDLSCASSEDVIRFTEDGQFSLEFRVKDKENADWFTSSATDTFKKIYLKDTSNHIYGGNTASTAPVLNLQIDTDAPLLEVKGMQLLASVDETKDSWITEGYSNLVVGGPSTSFMKVIVEASDAGTGIGNVQISAKLDGDAVTPIDESTSTSVAPVTDLLNLSATINSAAAYEVIIPCTITGVEKENVNFVVTLTATDNAGKSRSEAITLKADTKRPIITITSPLSTTHLSGSVTVEGQISESAIVSYSISPVETSPDDYTNATPFSYIKYDGSDHEITPAVTLPTRDKSGAAITPAQSLATTCAYQSMSDSSMMSFYLSFDGKEDSSGIHSDTLNKWIQKIGITTPEDLRNPTNPFDDMIKLYIHVKAEDSSGNVNELHYPLMLDPLGSRPTVSIGYPSFDQAGDTKELTLGGAPTIIGTATGTNAVNYVWLQVDCDSDGDWDYQDFNYLLRQKDESNTAIYSFGRMDNPAADISEELTSTDSAAEYAIRIVPTGINWVQQINKNGELNPPADAADSRKAVKIWAYATDAQGFVSSQEKRNLIIDSKSPVIDQDIWLVQWNTGFNGGNGFSVDTDGNISFESGAVKASQSYGDNENIKGKWFVIGKVSDSSGIKTVSYKVNNGSLVTAITDTDESYTGTGDNADAGTYIRRIAGNNYIFCLPIGSEAENSVGEYKVEFSAEEIEDSNPKSAERTFVVRYDNKAPEVVTRLEGYSNGTLAITNSNGVYTFGGVASEDNVDGVEQTGIKRIAFYFTRNITGHATKIFDPMIRTGRAGNETDYTGLVHEDNLYWHSLTVNTSGGTITVSDATALKNIHKGGLVKINGVIHTITGVIGNAVSVDDNLGNQTEINAKFAIANIIDNPTREGEGDRKISDEYGYGYYSNGSSDDGDLMVESLVQEGTKYTWEANINSRNISDGPAVLHYVVFDKAGNTTSEETFNCFIKNNQPRLAGVTLGTDENGNGTVEDSEFVNSYHNAYEHGYTGNSKIDSLTIPGNSTVEHPKSIFKIKGKTVVMPEIVGGNGNIGYTYTVAKRNAANTDWDEAEDSLVYNSGSAPTLLGSGTEEDDESIVSLTTSGGIKLEVKDFLQNNIADGNNQKFTFTIWDSTPGLTYGTDSQYATLTVIMDVALNDGTPALNKIIPFYWKSATNNSLKDNSTTKGHIELSKDLPEEFISGGNGIYSLNPKVSGAVKLEGIAQDNTLLRSISVTIDGTERTIATYSTEGNPADPWTPESDTGWSTAIRQATYGELIAAGYILETELPSDKDETDSVPYTSQAYGHVVHWTMVIDTEAMGITPKAGIEISASALDKGKPILSGTGASATVEYTSNPFKFNGGADATLEAVLQSGGDDGEGVQTCKYNIDVVPYIRGIKTKLSAKTSKEDSSEYDRTALGHYPVANTEKIYLYGFNLAGCTLYDSKTPTANSVTLGDADTTKYASMNLTVYETSSAVTNFTSGKVSVKYGTGDSAVESINNLNDNDAKGSYEEDLPETSTYGDEECYETLSNFYNRKPNESNNCVLTDDIILDVWKINSDAARASPSGRIDEVSMKINPASDSQIIGFSFLSGSMHFSTPKGKTNSYSNTGGTGNTGDFRTTSYLAYDWRGWSYALDAGGNEQDRVKFWIVNDAGEEKGSVNIEQVDQYGTRAQKDGVTTRTDLRYKVRSPSIVTSKADAADTTNMYMAYYDSYNDEIRYKCGTVNNDGTVTGIFKARRRNAYTCYRAQVIATDATTNLPEGAAYQYTGTPLGGAGEFVAIDVIPKGTTVGGTELAKDVVVIVWYDVKAKALKYSYNENPLDNDSWQSDNASVNKAGTRTINQDYRGLNRYGWEDASTIFDGAGEFCQVKVDGKGGVHIAAYDAVYGDLRYAYLPTYKSEYSESTMSYTVDSSGNTGSYLILDVGIDADDKAVPYISYFGGNMPKIAYMKSSAPGEGTYNDMFSGNWEVSYLPTTSTISDLDKKRLNNLNNRINVALWKDSDGVIKASTSDTSSATADSGVCYGNGTAYPVVGYSIVEDSANDRIETAQMQ